MVQNAHAKHCIKILIHFRQMIIGNRKAKHVFLFYKFLQGKVLKIKGTLRFYSQYHQWIIGCHPKHVVPVAGTDIKDAAPFKMSDMIDKPFPFHPGLPLGINKNSEKINRPFSPGAKLGKLMEAIDHFSEALRINPEHADTHNNIGIALAEQGRIAKAINHFSEALRINPAFENAQANLDRALTIKENNSTSKPNRPAINSDENHRQDPGNIQVPNS